jgi:FkbM family methyltransferase
MDKAQKIGHYDFIEIGTAFFDTEIQKNDGRIGISVDPVKEYIDMLPDVPNVIKECCAISNYDGYIDLFIPIVTGKYTEHTYIYGCVSVNHKHPQSFHFGELETEKRTVPVMSVSSFISKFNIISVDFLKIDTEGHDCTILHSWLDCKVFPNEIFFECKEPLNLPDDKLAITNRLKILGYEIEFLECDIRALKKCM